jgi:E3 ubiquitin-protein ligase RAD18
MEGLADVVAKLGALVRCPICGELLDAPVLFPECSHVFCSKCIRLALGYKTECPSCRGDRVASRLVPVPLLDEVAAALKALPNVDETLETLAKERSLKRHKENEGQMEEVNKVFTLGSEGMRVTCDSCKLMVRDLERHSEECLNKTDQERFRFAQLHGRLPTVVLRPQRLPKLNYKTTSAKKLQSVCLDLGISAKGTRTQLEWRHLQYVAMFNANLDHAKPLPVEMIREELKEMERAMFGPTLFKGKPARPEEVDWGKLVEAARPKDVKAHQQKHEVVVEMMVEVEDD